MPTYEFECQKCQEAFQEVMSLSDYEKKEKEGFRCPKCSNSEVQQMVSTIAVETSKKS